MRMDSPKISVIVPVYKVEAYLRKCLDSIAGQTYRNLEIILVDDGSPDNCGAICDEYAARDGRFVVIHKENGGVSTARNAGLAAATGDWIGWVDSDDWIEADMFEYLLTNALEYDADIAVCGHYEEYGDKAELSGWKEKQILDTETALKMLLENDQMNNLLWDRLWRREIFEGITFPIGRTFEDIAVMHRLFLKARRVICLPEAKYHYLQRFGGIMAQTSLNSRWNCYAAARQRYEELSDSWPQFSGLLAGQCIASAIGLWTVFISNPRQEREKYRDKMREIASFARLHKEDALSCSGLGKAGQLIVPFVSHNTWWAYAMAGMIGRLYQLKRGRML